MWLNRGAELDGFGEGNFEDQGLVGCFPEVGVGVGDWGGKARETGGEDCLIDRELGTGEDIADGVDVVVW